MKLFEIRQAAGLTQTQMAEKLGMNLRSYQRYENEGRLAQMPAQPFLTLCKTLNLDPYELLNNDVKTFSFNLKEAKAYLYYSNTDPLSVYEKDGLFWVNDCGCVQSFETEEQRTDYFAEMYDQYISEEFNYFLNDHAGIEPIKAMAYINRMKNGEILDRINIFELNVYDGDIFHGDYNLAQACSTQLHLKKGIYAEFHVDYSGEFFVD